MMIFFLKDGIPTTVLDDAFIPEEASEILLLFDC